jgi:16S rRNA (cytosine967-C5)-methyltransferase
LQKSARRIALDILGSTNGPPGLSCDLKRLDERDRALVKELVLGVERWKRFLDYYASFFCHRPVQRLSPKVLNGIRLGVYQMVFMGIPSYAAINSMVQCMGSKGERGFVNGVLRSISRNPGHVELPSLDTEIISYAAIRYSYPDWIVERYLRSFGLKDAISLLKSQNSPRPVTLRVNTARVDRDSLLKMFQANGYDAWPGSLDISIKVDKGRGVEQFPGYDEGLFVVQDEAAIIPTLALDPCPGDVVWDVCAAPGGKATHIAERVSQDGLVVASDIDSERAGMITRSCARLGLNNVATVALDATGPGEVEAAFKKRGLPLMYDKILVDPPCSGLGVIGKNPDIKWLRRESDIPKMARRQARILETARLFLRPGGCLVYSTCTLTHEENEDVWGCFVKKHGFAAALDSKRLFPSGDSRMPNASGGGYMYLLPHIHGTDGFFIARGLFEPGEKGKFP